MAADAYIIRAPLILEEVEDKGRDHPAAPLAQSGASGIASP
jgi:hypothetical protein